LKTTSEDKVYSFLKLISIDLQQDTLFNLSNQTIQN